MIPEKRNQRAYKATDSVYNKAKERADNENTYIANILEYALIAYSEGKLLMVDGNPMSNKKRERFIDLRGKKYGRLLVVSVSEKKSSRINGKCWDCICECGKKTVIAGVALRYGNINSCGCIPKIDGRSKGSRLSHGKCKSAEYTAWRGMISRCYNFNYKSYKYYGGNGITVSKEWKNSFENFYKDMGDRPSVNHSLDRIKVRMGYKKGNCRWATKKEQARNTTKNHFIKTKWGFITIAEAAELSGINPTTIRNRIIRGTKWDAKIK